MDNQPCIFLGIKVKPGPIERYKLENFALDNTVDNLKSEAEKKANVPSASLELIHHGKILKDDVTLQDSGVKSGEMVHVVKKKVQAPSPQPPTFSDNELQQLNSSLRTLGCTPNAPGWTRAMQLLMMNDDDSAMAEIIEHAPSIGEDCVALSILHEVELIAALGANIHTMRRGANAHPELPAALRHLMRLVRSRNNTTCTSSSDSVPTSGFAYSLEALSEDEDADEEESEDTERNPITQEQFTAALQAATDAISSSSSRGAVSQDSLLRLLQSAGESSRTTSSATESGTPTASIRSLITPEMFSEAISEAINRTSTTRYPSGTPMEQSHPATQELARIAANIAERDRLALASSGTPPNADEQRSAENVSQANLSPRIDRTEASSSQSPVARDNNEDFSTQLQHMHEMGLLDDALNIRALLICAGDVNAAINLVFSGAIGDE